jgi:DnaK suppressor protein
MALSSEQIQQLKQRLEARRTELRTLIGDELAAAGDDQLVGQARDTGDDALMDLLSGVDLAVAEIDTQELMDIRAALDRIEAGTYGVCVDCGVDIEPARLESQSVASRCIDCQEKFEEQGGVETPRM